MFNPISRWKRKQPKELRIIMNKSLRWLFPIAAPILAISMTAFLAACGGDDDDDGDTTPAVLQSSAPADGATVPQGSIVTLNFDKNPGAVTVNGTAAEGSGKKRTFTVTQASNAIAWDNGGTATLNFTLTEPDTTPPSLSSSSPKDGATGVDPDDINQNGIMLTFNETISKSDLMVSKDGDNLGWISSAEGDTVTLNATPANPLVNETTYEVSGSVEDASGNSGDVSISFTTKAKDD